LARGVVDNLNSHNAEVAGHDIKGSYINRIYMKSSMLWLYIITIVLSYAHKLPYIGKIIMLLSLWYGKTTWWKILVKIRKLFIVFNAIIGVLLVFKTTGFSSDNIFAGIAGMGHTYLEIFYNFTKRMFYWFVELFDHKIVPNVPSTGGGNPPSNSWFKGNTNTGSGNKSIFVPSGIELPNIIDSKPFSLRSLYKDGVINTPSSWYKDWSTLLWWSATLVGIAGAAYLGYKIIVDPSIITNLWSTNNINGPTSPINPTSPSGSSASTITPVNNGILSSLLSFTNKLNPLNWFTSVSETNTAREIFMERQNQITSSDMRYYPFTEVNPYDSWFNKLRIKWLGENTYELANRLRDKAAAMRETNFPSAKAVAESVQSSPLPVINDLGPLSGFNTPRLGLGLKFTSSTGLVETIEASSSWNKLSSVASTPSHKPISLPALADMNVESISSVIPSWNDHVINQAELNRYVDAKNGYTYAKAVSSYK
jgi:hypothetical protein